MTDREVAARLAAARAEAARRHGLLAWPGELIAVSERLGSRSGFCLARRDRAALEARRKQLLREMRNRTTTRGSQ